jgi:hypothetical protein
MMIFKNFTLLLIFGITATILSCKQQYLTGYLSKEEFNKQCKWRNKYATNYKPNPIWSDSLKRITQSYDVQVYLGTWCSDSRKWVPPFLKVAETLPINTIEIIAVDTTKKDSKGYWKTYNIDSVPTFMFFKNGELAGRINVKPQKSKGFFSKRILERDLYYLLKSK